MKLANIVVLGPDGSAVWDGTITSFVKANNRFPNEFPPIDWRTLCADLRGGINTAHGRPEPATIGDCEASLVC